MYTTFIAVNELQIHTVLEQAREFAEEGKLLHAVQLYRRLLHAVPLFEEPYLRIAQIYAEWGRYDQAEQLLLTGHRRNPGNPEFMLMLGELFQRRGDYGAAVECYSSLGPMRLPEAHFNLGIAYMRQEQWKKAEEELRLTLLLDPHFPEVHEILGEILIKRKQYSTAASELRRGIRDDHYSAVAHRLLGIALLNQYEYLKALDEFVLAVDMDPHDAAAWQLCGDTLLRLRRFGEAEPYLERALALNPHSPDASASFGFLCLYRGERAKALDAFNNALKEQPGHPRALDGRLHLKLQSEHPT